MPPHQRSLLLLCRLKWTWFEHVNRMSSNQGQSYYVNRKYSKIKLHVAFEIRTLCTMNPPKRAQLLWMCATKGMLTWCRKAQVTRGRSVQSQPLRAWKLGLTHSHKIPSPKSQVTRGWSVQSQPSRPWKLGLTNSRRTSSPKSQL